MIAEASVLSAIHRELSDAEVEARTIHHIRVTADAVAGSVVAAPITPERARTIRLQAFPSSRGAPTVDADAELIGRPLLEVLVHPDDWAALLRNIASQSPDIGMVYEPGPIRRVLGIPVVER